MGDSKQPNLCRQLVKGREVLSILAKQSVQPRKTEILGVFFKDPVLPNDAGDLALLIGLPRSALSPAVVNSIEAIEAIESDDTKTLWLAFKWRLLAFFSIQDAFQMHIYKDSTPDEWFRTWYFYFESKHLLVEAICSGLNGLHSAINSLMRLFLEFTF